MAIGFCLLEDFLIERSEYATPTFAVSTLTGQLGLEHQVCQFHVRRWVGRTLKQLRETVPKEYQ